MLMEVQIDTVFFLQLSFHFCLPTVSDRRDDDDDDYTMFLIRRN